MTPEERAREVFPYLHSPTGVEELAAAIRAAENDALERAAKSLDAEDPYTWAAFHVRKLKHKEEKCSQ